MTIEVNKKFLKGLARIPIVDRQKIEKFVFEESKNIETIELAGIFEKMKGYQNYYRARFGSYRVGVSYQSGTLVFERVLHRNKIYRFFP